MADNHFDQYDDHPPSMVTAGTDYNPAKAAPAPEPSVGRGLGLAARDVAEGVLGAPYDLIAKGINATGFLPPINTLGENLTRLGLPEPVTPSERMISAIQQPVVGALATQGVGRTMLGAANPTVRAVGQTLSDQPVVQAVSAGGGGAATEATGDPRIGLATSMAMPFGLGLAGAAGRALERGAFGGIHPEDAALGRIAQDKYNIPINTPDLTDNTIIRTGADQMGKIPFSGARPSIEAKQQAWQGAIATEMGEPGATNFRSGVMTAAKERIGKAFDDVAARTNIPQQQTDAMVQDLAKILPDAELVLDTHLPNIAKQIREITNLVGRNGGTIPGDTYQAITRRGAPLDLLEGSADPNVAHFAGRIRDAVDDAFVRSASPADQEALQQARYQYRVMRTIDPLVAKSRTGDITPDGFMEKVAAASRKFDAPTAGMAYTGGGNIGELARIGKLMRAAPNSGTAERVAINAAAGAFGGGAAAASAAHLMEPTTAGLTVAGLAANRAANSYLRSQGLANRLLDSTIAPQNVLPNELMRALQTLRTSGVTGVEALAQNQRGRQD